MWREKTLIAVALAGACFLLYWSFRLEPAGPNHSVRGPIHLAPCGFRIRYGVPCPTCYMTRTFALMARGRVGAAVKTQPFAAVGFAIVLLAAPLLLIALLSRRSVWPIVVGWRWRTILIVAFLFALGSWGYTIIRDLQR